MMILVLPKDESMVKVLRHPNKDVRTFVDVRTAIEWPLDQFTIRRLSDGDIKKVGEVPHSNLPRKQPPSLKFKRPR
jgi:hypothetical protein